MRIKPLKTNNISPALRPITKVLRMLVFCLALTLTFCKDNNSSTAEPSLLSLDNVPHRIYSPNGDLRETTAGTFEFLAKGVENPNFKIIYGRHGHLGRFESGLDIEKRTWLSFAIKGTCYEDDGSTGVILDHRDIPHQRTSVKMGWWGQGLLPDGTTPQTPMFNWSFHLRSSSRSSYEYKRFMALRAPCWGSLHSLNTVFFNFETAPDKTGSCNISVRDVTLCNELDGERCVD